MSVPVGLDVGASTSKIGVARNRGIDIIANEASSRLTPSLVGFGARSRSLGESALTQQSSNFKNTIGSLRRLIGRSFSDPEVQSHESRFINAEVVDVKGQVGFRVNYLGEQQVFSVTQIYAMLLGKLRDTASAELKSPVNTAVITVPGWYTDAQRRAVLDAADIAGLKVPRLVNDTTASAIGYGIVRSDLPEVGETPRKVVFCDIGHSDYSVTIVAFNKGKMSVLATAHDRNFGGRDLDYALVEHFSDEFKDKYKIDVRSNKKATFRLAVAVEKLKKILSANAQAPLNVESIMNDIDASSSLTREEFEKLIQSLLDRTTQPLEAALKQAGLAAAEVDFVELLGGSCRVPGIRSRIQQFFDKPLSATLNSEEAIARGATFICATLSPGFRVREMETLDVCPYAVEIAWERAPEDAADEGTSLVMFPHGNSFPSAKIVRLRRSEAFDLEARYADSSAVPGGASWIARCTVKNVRKGADGTAGDIKVRARINDSGLFQFDSSATLSEYADAEAEAEAPVDAPEPNGDAAAPAKKARKVTKTELPVIFYSASLDSTTLEDYRAKEGEMSASDRLVYETENAKNALEEYIYDMRSKIDSGGSLAVFASTSEKDTLREKLTAAEDWLYDEGDDAAKSAYVSKLDELKKLGDPIVFRYREHDERPRTIKALRETLADLNSKVTGGEERYAHLTDADRETVIKHVSDHESWINNQVARQAERARHENATLTTAEIEKRRQQALYDCTPIVAKPKPAVPTAAKETKKEPEPAAKGDAEMADAPPAAEADEIEVD